MTKITISILLCLIAYLPTQAQSRVPIEHWTASTGARIYFVPSHALPIFDVRIDFVAGTAHDPSGKSGLASLTAGLLDSGVNLDEVDLNEEQIAERFANIAAHLNISVDTDRVSISLRSLSSPKERDSALALMRALLTAPTFPPEAMEREKIRSVAAIREAETRPDSLSARRFQQAIYPHHPYGMIPTIDSMSVLTRDDVMTYWRTHFGAHRATISIIGDIARVDAEAIAVRLTDRLPEVPVGQPLPTVTQPERTLIKILHPAMQSHIHMGLPSIKRSSPDFFPLLVGNYIFGGGGFVSRLMKNVREKRGYAYSVYSRFDPYRLEGPFEIGLQTKQTQAADAIAIVEATLSDFLKNGPTPQEMDAARRHLADGLALRLDSNAKILGYLALIGFYDLPLNYIDDYPHRIESVTAQQVRNAFVRHIRPEHMVTVMTTTDDH